MTYSPGCNRRPCQRRSYRSRTRPAFSRKSRSRANTHERHAHGRIASSESQRHTVVPETSQTIPRATASRASSAADQRDSARPDSAGSSHASALTSAISAGGKRPGTPRPGPFIEPRDALGGEPSSPLGRRLVGAVQPPRDLGVAHTLGRQQHHLRADHLAMRTRVLPRATTQLTLLRLAESDRRLGHHIRDSPRLWQLLPNVFT
jgi:hypothetical protein